MADTMTFDLVSPERRLVSGEATAVQIPGSEGDLTAMPNHAPMITTLRPGILTVEMADGVQHFAVTGGMAEITGSATSVLAENAYPKSSEHRAAVEGHLEQARTAHSDAADDQKDVAQKLVADLAELVEAMV